MLMSEMPFKDFQTFFKIGQVNLPEITDTFRSHMLRKPKYQENPSKSLNP